MVNKPQVSMVKEPQVSIYRLGGLQSCAMPTFTLEIGLPLFSSPPSSSFASSYASSILLRSSSSCDGYHMSIPHVAGFPIKTISLFKHYENTGRTLGNIKSGQDLIWHRAPLCGDCPEEDNHRKSTATSLWAEGRMKDKEIFHRPASHPSVHPTCAKLPFLPAFNSSICFSLFPFRSLSFQP